VLIVTYLGQKNQVWDIIFTRVTSALKTVDRQKVYTQFLKMDKMAYRMVGWLGLTPFVTKRPD
jgi:hypothetical protein